MPQAEKFHVRSALSEREVALVSAHRANIQRFQSLLKMSLSNEDRAFVERRLAEEQAAIDQITGTVELTQNSEDIEPPLRRTLRRGSVGRTGKASAKNGSGPSGNIGL